jgi:hypothetical protein
MSIFKQISSATLSIITLMSVASPIVAAVELPKPPENKVGDRVFCTQIGGISDKIGAEIEKKKGEHKAKHTEIEIKKDAKVAEWSKKLSDNRTKWDTARSTEFAKLNELAKTDAQKAAVEKFISTMKAAIELRRSSNDSANMTFKEAVKAATGTQSSNTEASAAQFKAAVEAAKAKAQAACTAGTEIKTVKDQLKADMEAARKAFKEARTPDTKIGETVKQLQATRKASVDANDKAFKATAEAAKAALKTALGE